MRILQFIDMLFDGKINFDSTIFTILAVLGFVAFIGIFKATSCLERILYIPIAIALFYAAAQFLH